MRESTREFIKDLCGQSRDNTAMIIEGVAIAEGTAPPHKTYEQFEMERKAREAQERARIERIKRGERTANEEKALTEGLKEMLGSMRAEMEEKRKAEEAKAAALWDGISSALTTPEGLKNIEDLLEIENNKAAYLNSRIEEAKEEGNEALLEKYQEAKAANDKNIELYRSKYEEYKAASKEA